MQPFSAVWARSSLFYRPYVSRLWRDMKNVYTSLWTICRSCLMLLGCGLLPAPLIAANISLEMESVSMDQRPASRASQNSHRAPLPFCRGNHGDANFKASWQKRVYPPHSLFSKGLQCTNTKNGLYSEVGDALVQHVKWKIANCKSIQSGIFNKGEDAFLRNLVWQLYFFPCKNDVRHTLESTSDI